MMGMNKQYPGTFITLEGIDNAGKSSVIKELADELTEMGHEVVVTSEPSSEWTGPVVRKAIASESAEHALTAFYLFMADRVKHINDVILPALDEGKIVISDRFADSTYAYQSISLEGHVMLPEKYIEKVMRPFVLEPDLTLFLDIDVDTSIARGRGGDVYENEKYLKKVSQRYSDLMRNNDRFIKIDATKHFDNVMSQALYHVLGEL